MSNSDQRSGRRLTIVVSGEIFEMSESRFAKYPDTLLGNPSLRSKHLDPMYGTYFFDRHRLAFEGILFYYQSNGKVICPDNVPYEVFQDELEFFGIKEPVVSEKAKAFILHPYDHVFHATNTFKSKTWLMLQDPNGSLHAKIFSIWSLFVTVMSIVLTISVNSSNSKKGIYSSLFPYEIVCFSWFTFECALRIWSSPNKLHHFRNFVDIIDVCSILVYYISLMIASFNASSVSILRIFRIANIFRIFKLTRYSYGLRLLLYTVYTSRLDLQILGACLCFFIIVSASMMYYAEMYEPDSLIDNIPNAIWWAIVTCTTVGYGDAVPLTVLGKVVGSCTAIFGALMVLMPVLKFVQSFGDALMAAKPYLKNAGGKGRISLVEIKH